MSTGFCHHSILQFSHLHIPKARTIALSKLVHMVTGSSYATKIGNRWLRGPVQSITAWVGELGTSAVQHSTAARQIMLDL